MDGLIPPNTHRNRPSLATQSDTGGWVHGCSPRQPECRGEHRGTQRDITTDDNRDRLRLLIALFDLSVADIGREIGLSRGYVSRFLNGDETINAKALVARLEVNVGRIVDRRRRRAFFSVEPASVETVQSALAAIEPRSKAAA